MQLVDFEKATQMVSKGKIGVLPTDTIYGISGLALREKVVKEIESFKDRRDDPFIILISSLDDLNLFGVQPTVFQLEKLEKWWPGPVSVIFPVNQEKLNYLHKGKRTLAFRIPQKRELRKLIAKVGPVVSTSVNPRGEKPAENSKEAQKYFGSQLDFYVDEGEKESLPSSLIIFDGERVEILRKGPGNI